MTIPHTCGNSRNAAQRLRCRLRCLFACPALSLATPRIDALRPTREAPRRHAWRTRPAAECLLPSRHPNNIRVRMLGMPAACWPCVSMVRTATLESFGGAYVFSAISRHRRRWRTVRHHRISRRATNWHGHASRPALRASRRPSFATTRPALHHRRRRTAAFHTLSAPWSFFDQPDASPCPARAAVRYPHACATFIHTPCG